MELHRLYTECRDRVISSPTHPIHGGITLIIWNFSYFVSHMDAFFLHYWFKGDYDNTALFIRFSPEFLPVLGLLTQWCASTLGAALLCSSRAGSIILYYLLIIIGFIHPQLLLKVTLRVWLELTIGLTLKTAHACKMVYESATKRKIY